MSKLQQLHRRTALKGARQPLEWLVFLLLLPFSAIYGLISWLRNKCYDWGIFSRFCAEVPVVSVGNLAVGGTGKTPVVDWLVKEFLSLGKKPAVVSRGYGGTFSGKVGVVSNGEGLLLEAEVSGDEPFLLAHKNPEAIVLIARKRAAGVQVAVDHYGADVVILDDGFQHRAVERDLDLVLLDASNPCANGWPLPAGLLREFPNALRRADVLLLTRAEEIPRFSLENKQIFYCRHQLENFAVDLSGQQLSFHELKKLKLLAFAGIADPQSFFLALKYDGLVIENSLSLSDHCDYDQSLQAEIRSAAAGCEGMITTEKDAVKLKKEMFSLPCYQVPMAVDINAEDAFREMVQTFVRRS